ncbi:MAG: SDR family NAD(P)-dependent oxidoreductase, partial [Novosphingobium sp.]|uniref:SDR family NAD(P)-dependent oxidoreductase n=1 Tax=Novosphingobium sp. TaxID=1874826 RepID=UPI00391C83E4
MASLFDLTGTVALVTGGNSGIGLGKALSHAQHGATVVIWGTNAERNAQAAEQLRSHGGEVRAARIDVSKEAAVSAGIAAIV